MSPEEWIDHFIRPMMDLGFEPKGDIVAIASALAEDAPAASIDHGREAVKLLRRKCTYRSFPALKLCLDAVFEAISDDGTPVRRWTPPPVAPSGNPPMLQRARKRVAAWKRASDGERRQMTRVRWMDEAGYASARRIMELYGEDPDEEAV